MGAFSFFNTSKKELLWNAHFILSKSKKTSPTPTLFNRKVKTFNLPELYYHPLEHAYDEIELLGFPVSCSAFELIEKAEYPAIVAAHLKYHIGKNIEIIGKLVHVKRTKASNGKIMSFGVFIDFEGHWIDTVQFPRVEATHPFRGGGCYLIKGKVVEEFGFVSIEATEIHRIANVNTEEPSTRLKPPNTIRLISPN